MSIPSKLLELTTRALFKASSPGMKKGAHVTRYAMYEQLSRYAEPRPQGAKVLSISHSEPLARMLGFADEGIVDASYPEHDVFALAFSDAEFDAVISDQVLEHVEGDPQRAIDEMYRVLKPGGLALHTTCFINPIHYGPGDYWRFTPAALRLLAERGGEVIEAAGWGNPYVWAYIGVGLRFEPIPHARWHPAHHIATKNDPSWPITTWVLAKKRG